MTKTYESQGIEFTLEESYAGLFTSVSTDGERMITAATPEACIDVTQRIHIPVKLGTFEGYTSEPRSSTVGGKL